MNDSIVAEIRKQRAEHARRFKGDLDAIVADYQRIEKESGLQTTRRPARRIAKPAQRSYK